MIHQAVEAKSLEAVKAALAAGADVNELDARGFTALVKACAFGTAPMVATLLEAGANPRLGKGSVLSEALKRRNDVLLDLLLAAGADPNRRHGPDPYDVPLNAAHSARAMAALLEKGAAVEPWMLAKFAQAPGSAKERVALVSRALAAEGGSPQQLLGALIESHDGPELDGWVAQLVARGASLAPADACSPLHLAAAGTFARAAAALVKLGASVETPLAVPWEEREWPAGVTVRELFEGMRDAELSAKPSKGRLARLAATAKALGLSSQGAARPVPSESPFGIWKETGRLSHSDDEEARERTVKGGTLEWKPDGSGVVTGSLGCGLGKKSQLTLEGTSVIALEKERTLRGSLRGGALRISSEPDDEHGLVVTSVFERAAKKKTTAPKAPVRKR